MSGVFDYYYGEESESCSFYRIPRLLIVGKRFSGLSIEVVECHAVLSRMKK